MNGYVILGRKIKETVLWSKPPYYIKLWVFFLFKAYFKDSGGLKRGEFRTNYDEISDALSYGAGYRRVKVSKKEIYRALKFLKEGGGEAPGSETKIPLIEVKRISGGIIIRLLNYDKTQNPEEYGVICDDPAEGERAESCGAKGVRGNKEKSKKEIKNKNKSYRPKGSRFVNFESRDWDFESIEALEEEYLKGELKKEESAKSGKAVCGKESC